MTAPTGTQPTRPTGSGSPFADLDAFCALPRLAGLTLSVDGSRLVTSVATLSPDGARWTTSLWEVDPAGQQPPRRLTRPAPGQKAGESTPAFTPEGDLLFTSRRSDPSGAAGPRADGAEEDKPALWLLPAAGGEARPVAARPGGITGVAVSRDSGTVAVTSPTMPGAADADADEKLRSARKDAKVSALLHESYPIRYWDHDLGPSEQHLLTAAPPADGDDDSSLDLRDLTREPGRALDEQQVVLTADGSQAVTGWAVAGPRGQLRATLVAIDTTTGERRALLDETDHDAGSPAVSPDDRFVVCVRSTHSSYDDPPRPMLWLVPLDGGAGRDLLGGADLQPVGPQFTGDGSAVVFTADLRGHSPVFRVELGNGRLTQLTASGAYHDLCPSPDGRWVYAMRSAMDSAPWPVRIDLAVDAGEQQEPVRLRGPGETVDVPGSLTEVTTTAADGTPLRAWLALPDDATDASPAPVLLFIHGGPLGSWNDWNWRWSPWVAVARGYAVLLPDPALSTGYGHDFLRRGWGRWGAEPYTDLMALTDAALARGDLDEERVAALGGSFGGYMANWVAGHTDRFAAVVTHASLWALEQMMGSTDMASYWEREFGNLDTHPERYEANSPHHHVASIRTPMLVIHGDKDYRVPVGEALRLWWDLTRHEVDAKFLYFPDENHWVLTPGNAKVWYETVLAFCDHHVLGKEWARPALL